MARNGGGGFHNRKMASVGDAHPLAGGSESVYFCQPGIHRSPHRPSVDTIYFDNFILADTLEEVVKEVPGRAP